MPVWHRETKAHRESGELVVIGIVQEQHPERARLWAQWQGIDWPILWDPLNLTNSSAVPNKSLIDEHGIVRSLRPKPQTLEEEFLGVDFPAPEGAGGVPAAPDAAEAPTLVQFSRTSAAHPQHAIWRAYGEALWGDDDALDGAIRTVGSYADAHADDARQLFRLGVLHRMRHDREDRDAPGDFQAALELWSRALALDPRQYIWRRRIQQFGPLLDKPYPFYPWIEEATSAVRDAGGEPVEICEHLSGAEVLGPKGTTVRLRDLPEIEAPPPVGQESGLVGVVSAVVPDTSKGSGAVRVFVGVRPADRRVQWDHEPGPARIALRVPGETERWVGVETHGRGHAQIDAWVDFELDGAEAERVLEGVVSLHTKMPRGHAHGEQRLRFVVRIPARQGR